MPYPKLKTENYSNYGGINRKASRYLTGPQELLDIKNFDLSRTGSLTSRPGTTFYVGFALATGKVTGLYEYIRLAGASYVLESTGNNMWNISSGSAVAIGTSFTLGALFDFETFVDRMFAANGAQFFKWDGASVTNYSLPPGGYGNVAGPTSSFSIVPYPPINLTTLGSGVALPNGMTGYFLYSIGYLNERGYAGPSPQTFGVSAAGCTGILLSFGYTSFSPTGWGITAQPVYRSNPNGSNLFRIGYMPVNGMTFLDSNLPLTTNILPTYLWFTLAPQFIEIYNNQLFTAGFSTIPSAAYFSDIGEPEGVGATAFFEVRTNDGDVLTGMKSYLQSLIMFKKKSYHQLLGQDPADFQLQELSTEYGCISNRAVAIYRNLLWFLDIKGICQFDGANTQIISDKIEDIFQNMNQAAAYQNAWMSHVKDRNEVWCGIPANGATFNNTLVVFDYVAGGWAVFENITAACMNLTKGNLNAILPVFGGYSGQLSYQAPGLFTDTIGTGVGGFTCVLKSRFITDLGNSTEKVFRRLWVDVDPILSVTAPIAVNLYINQATTPSFTGLIYANQFQNRVEFGLPGKDLSVELIYSAAAQLRFNGFSVAYRYQREV